MGIVPDGARESSQTQYTVFAGRFIACLQIPKTVMVGEPLVYVQGFIPKDHRDHFQYI